MTGNGCWDGDADAGGCSWRGPRSCITASLDQAVAWCGQQLQHAPTELKVIHGLSKHTSVVTTPALQRKQLVGDVFCGSCPKLAYYYLHLTSTPPPQPPSDRHNSSPVLKQHKTKQQTHAFNHTTNYIYTHYTNPPSPSPQAKPACPANPSTLQTPEIQTKKRQRE